MQSRKTLWVSALTLAALGLAAGVVSADGNRGKISGSAVDAATGQALSGVTVVVTPSGKRTASNASGAFSVAGVPAGSYTVRCAKAGYRTAPARPIDRRTYSVQEINAGRVRVSGGAVEFVLCSMQRAVPAPEPEEAAAADDDEDRGAGRDEASAESRPSRVAPAKPAPPPRTTRTRRKSPSAPALGSVGYGQGSGRVGGGLAVQPSQPAPRPIRRGEDRPHNTESYDKIDDNAFKSAQRDPLSTLSIDVDTASYSNVRRYIEQMRQLPPADAVKIEELINYFDYDYAGPRGETPFSVTTEMSSAPWNPAHKLVHVGIQGRKIATDKLPPSNLVFLIDVSGSMSSANKLPLLIEGYKLLVNSLRAKDRVAIVVYAGAAGLVLPSTPGTRKGDILAALDRLSAGGSTAGAAGIELAYKVARQNFIRGGNNRVILATDGDFNVGTSSDGDLVRLIEGKRKQGVFLTVLGFGSGNYKDSKMEKLADKGNGNHAYIDSVMEAKKVLVSEMGGTLFTIAKDVKIQVEFNPARVKAYRLIGYENRLLAAQDFNDDTKDAGELGAGHTVTALYEVIPAGSAEKVAGIDELKYQRTVQTTAAGSDELMTIKLRYKAPNGNKSKLITHPLRDRGVALARTSRDFRWSAAVAAFGMLLRDSEHKGNASWGAVLELASGAKGQDPNGYRAGFIGLVQAAQRLAPPQHRIAR